MKLHVGLRIKPRGEIDERYFDSIDLVESAVVYKTRRDSISGRGIENRASFDYVFPPGHGRERICPALRPGVVDALKNGGSCTVMCYGQTGSGKTHTMAEVAPYLIDQFYSLEGFVERDASLSASQIYMERPVDMFTSQTLEVRGMEIAEIFRPCGDCEEATRMFWEAQEHRVKGKTSLNATSSRSHAIYSFRGSSNGTPVELRLVDLAGTEDPQQQNQTYSALRREEGKSVNQSLLFLRKCLQDSVDGLLPSLRQSKLTMILRHLFSGRGSCILLLCVHDSAERVVARETRSTIAFGDVFRRIKPIHRPVQRFLDHSEIYRLRAENSVLRQELEVAESLLLRFGDERKIRESQEVCAREKDEFLHDAQNHESNAQKQMTEMMQLQRSLAHLEEELQMLIEGEQDLGELELSGPELREQEIKHTLYNQRVEELKGQVQKVRDFLKRKDDITTGKTESSRRLKEECECNSEARDTDAVAWLTRRIAAKAEEEANTALLRDCLSAWSSCTWSKPSKCLSRTFSSKKSSASVSTQGVDTSSRGETSSRGSLGLLDDSESSVDSALSDCTGEPAFSLADRRVDSLDLQWEEPPRSCPIFASQQPAVLKAVSSMASLKPPPVRTNLLNSLTNLEAEMTRALGLSDLCDLTGPENSTRSCLNVSVEAAQRVYDETVPWCQSDVNQANERRSPNFRSLPKRCATIG
jgi:hypothetical protein